MKKRYFALFLALLLCLGAAGCAKVVPTQEPPAPQTESGGASQPQEPAGETPPVSDPGDEAGETGEATEEPALPETGFVPGPGRTGVENNGGACIRVGDRIYFRQYGKNALLRTALFGRFTDNANRMTGSDDPDALSQIMVFDTKTRTSFPAFSEHGYGPLWFGNNGFYLQQLENGADAAVWYAVDGSERREIAMGTILGLSESGDLLALSHYEIGAGYVLSLYRSGELTAQVASGKDYAEFVGLTDNELFYLTTAHEDGLQQLWQLPADGGEPFVLGDLPAAPNNSRYMPEQCLTADGRVAAMLCSYEGTGHFLSDWLAAQARIGGAGSLSPVVGEAEHEPDSAPRLYADAEGRFCLAAHLPGEVRINTSVASSGDLELYEAGSFHTLARGRLADAADGYAVREVAQSVEYLGDAVCLTVARCHLSPLDSIGWRDAYTLLDMRYLLLPVSQDRVYEMAHTDHETVIEGRVWFLGEEGSMPDTLLWQQTRRPLEEGEEEETHYTAYLEPIDPKLAFFLPGENGLVRAGTAELTALADAYRIETPEETGYYGCSLPETEGLPVRFRFGSDNRIVWLASDAALPADAAQALDALTAGSVSVIPFDGLLLTEHRWRGFAACDRAEETFAPLAAGETLLLTFEQDGSGTLTGAGESPLAFSWSMDGSYAATLTPEETPDAAEHVGAYAIRGADESPVILWCSLGERTLCFLAEE